MIEVIELEAVDDEARPTGGETDEADRPPSYPPEDPPDPPWSREELECAIPMQTNRPGKLSYETVTGTSAETGRRYHPRYILRPSPGRETIRLKHALAARDGRLPRSK
jgi:hypothetical protein